MGEAMAGATKAMAAMNRRMNLPAVAKIMREFEKQNERMEMTSEMMGDAGGGGRAGRCLESGPQGASLVGWGSCLVLAAGHPAAWQVGGNVSKHGGLGAHLPAP